MRFIPKSKFFKLHLFIAGFTFLSILSGLSLKYGFIPGYTIRTIHFYIGILILISPLIVLAFMKKRWQVLNAFKTLTFINKMDIRRKRYLYIVSKLILALFILGLLKQLLTGLAIKLQIFKTPDMVNGLYMAHSTAILLLPVLLVLHAALMILSKKGAKSKTPVK